MKKTTLTHLTHAHGWLGIIISALLFLVFFAGSISLFRYEIFQWSVQPTQPVHTGEILPVSKIMELAIEGREFNAKEHLTVLPPIENKPYYRVYVDLIEDIAGREYVGLLMDPVTGKVIGELEQFLLADFIYKLHRDLNLEKPGLYLLGFVTLFFAFIVVSGIFIHAKKLFSNFFKYRTESNQRSQLLDMHNVVGTISLPFTLMYALSGLIFNLVIIYQISFALILYKGDQDALLADAGIHDLHVEWQNKPTVFKNIDQLVAKYTDELRHPPAVVRMYNYGDQSVVMNLIGHVGGTFAQRYEVAVQLSDQHEIYKDDEHQHSAVRHGTDVLAELHFGSFAGIDIRLIFFVLGLAVCVLIVTGNLLWIEKRQKKVNITYRSVSVMTKVTLISTLGVGLACCIAFLMERIIPTSFITRADLVIYSFLTCVAFVAITSFFITKQQLLEMSFFAASLVLLLTLVIDWLKFSDNLVAIWKTGDLTVFAVQLGILVLALFFAKIAMVVRYKQPLAPSTEPVLGVYA